MENTVLLISCETIGRGDETLGQILTRSFCHVLNEVTPRPDTIIFLNSGVKLVIGASPVLADLQALAA